MDASNVLADTDGLAVFNSATRPLGGAEHVGREPAANRRSLFGPSVVSPDDARNASPHHSALTRNSRR